MSGKRRAATRRIHAPGTITTLLAAAISLAGLAADAHALSCTTQSALKPDDRRTLVETGNTLAAAIVAQKLDTLQASLLPAVTGDWDGMKSVAQSAAPLLQGGTPNGAIEWGDAYLLDATELKGPTDSQFFCTNADSQVTITINLHNLPPGKFALLLGDASGAPLAGQLALILGQDGTQWKLGGLFSREGALDGHDGVYYWSEARKYAAAHQELSAWLTYDIARWLLIPVDFLSSPHLEKLNHEQQNGTNPAASMPLTVTDTAGKAWKITNLRIDPTLHHADIALTYESTGSTDPAAARAEAVAVMSALLKLRPEIREHFHGLWAYAEKDGRQNYAIELAMHDIP